jgi:3'(2'), 5'-bisphosphate nucleotidase
MSTNLFSLSQIIDIAFQAGEEILEIYDDKRLFSSSRLKKEKSPYTIAKLKAENLIIKRLQELGNEIPIISEKHNKVSYYYRKNWEQFWLVDALNGVKEYLKQTNEFTINIGLINNGIPVLGVVYAPALKLIYAADGEEGAIRIHKHKKVKIKTNKNSLYLIAAKALIESPFDQEESKELEISYNENCNCR